MASVYQIIQGINQAAANAYDGSSEVSQQADNRARTVGLKREDGHYINDRRVMDGFGVKFHGPILQITYQAEVLIKQVQDNNFENDIEQRLADIVKFLKKEYKAITGDTLTLTKEGDSSILVQRISNYRTDVQAHCDYRIGGLTEVIEVNAGSDEERLDKAVRDWLSLGKGK
jgi:lipopolysaccharide assembly outer membrane protein LptD (OstA)